MVKFKLIKGGWILRPEGTDVPTVCEHCNVLLEGQFYYCRDFNVGFCTDCEHGTYKSLCKSRQNEHEHYNIIDVDKDDTG